jgi:DNA repair photolyase
MRIETATRQCGITRTAHEEKLLCQFAGNTGFLCGHFCTYCSTPTILRIQIKKLGFDPYEKNLCIVDPTTPERLAHDARHKQKRGLIELCPLVDAWAPEALKYDLGRRSMEAILCQPGWTVRILTKNAAIRKDFDFIEKHKDRVLFGLSITGTPDKSDIMSVIEPHASSNSERIAVMQEAHTRGLRTYGMLCPLLPGIANSPEQIEQLIKLAVEYGAEEIFVEPVNARGRGLKLTQKTLESNGYTYEAACIQSIRHKENWSWYVSQLVKNTQKSVRHLYDLRKLRFLLYPSKLEAQDLDRIKQDGAGVIWL